MKRMLGMVVAMAVTLLLPVPGATAVPEPGAVLAAKKSKGRLIVRVTGSGSYTITGKRVRKTASVSKTFRLKPGSYRVAASGAVLTRKKVRVRKGRTVRVGIAFAPTTPAPSTPAPSVPPAPTTPPTPEPSIVRISTSAAGVQGDDTSEDAVWSPDGTKVAFVSAAGTLVPGDTNGSFDVFVKTLATGAIERISVSSAGAQGVGASYQPAWSPDGTRIAFTSNVASFVNDTNGAYDIFVKQLATGQIYRASTRADNSQAEGRSTEPTWSPDGGSLAFTSRATNLVGGDGNGSADVFVKNLALGGVNLVSSDNTDSEGNNSSDQPAWSADGTRIAFTSAASNLLGGDANGHTDLFIKTLSSDQITRVNGNGGEPNGVALTAAWAPVGNSLAFISEASNVVTADTNGVPDLFRLDLTGFITRRVSTDLSDNQANGRTTTFAWSPDGTRIAFSSEASNLVPGDTNGREDVFVKNLSTGTVTRVSLGLDGSQGNNVSRGPSWSPDGTRLAFDSLASNLVPGDSNAAYDVFVAKVG